MIQQPRQGRHKIAQGLSPGVDGPHPACGTPLPPERERGRGRGRALRTHGVRRGLLAYARYAGS